MTNKTMKKEETTKTITEFPADEVIDKSNKHFVLYIAFGIVALLLIGAIVFWVVISGGEEVVTSAMEIRNMRFCLDQDGANCPDTFLPGDTIYALFDVVLPSSELSLDFVENYVLSGFEGVLFRTDNESALEYHDTVEVEDVYLVPAYNSFTVPFDAPFGTYSIVFEVESKDSATALKENIELKSYMRLSELQTCIWIDNEGDCAGETDEFYAGDDFFVKYKVMMPSSDGRMRFTRDVDIYDSEGELLPDVSRTGLIYDYPVPKDGVYFDSLNDTLLLPLSITPGNYTLILSAKNSVFNASLQKRLVVR